MIILYVTNDRYLEYTEISLRSLLSVSNVDKKDIYIACNKCQPSEYLKQFNILSYDFEYHNKILDNCGYEQYYELFLRIKVIEELFTVSNEIVIIDGDTLFLKDPFVHIDKKYDFMGIPYEYKIKKYCACFCYLKYNKLLTLENYTKMLNDEFMLEEGFFYKIYKNKKPFEHNMQNFYSPRVPFKNSVFLHYYGISKPFEPPKEIPLRFRDGCQTCRLDIVPYYFKYLDSIGYKYDKTLIEKWKKLGVKF